MDAKKQMCTYEEIQEFFEFHHMKVSSKKILLVKDKPVDIAGGIMHFASWEDIEYYSSADESSEEDNIPIPH